MASRSAASRVSRKRSVLRRRAFAFAFVMAVVAVVGFSVAGDLKKGIRELALPLQHEDIIRQQAREKNLDPTLIAAVIYEESRFRPRESKAGAQGLMQILPATADFIAGRTGGVKFTHSDLATPQVNISYGAYYLRYLLDRYDDDTLTALAAYNAGEGRVDQWLQESGKEAGKVIDANEIPFPETRAYVKNVIDVRREYKKEYRKELTL